MTGSYFADINSPASYTHPLYNNQKSYINTKAPSPVAPNGATPRPSRGVHNNIIWLLYLNDFDSFYFNENTCLDQIHELNGVGSILKDT